MEHNRTNITVVDCATQEQTLNFAYFSVPWVGMW